MKISVKARLLYAIVLALVAAAYSVILFNVKHAWEDAHWIAYGFTLLAFLLLFLETFIPEGKYKRYPCLAWRFPRFPPHILPFSCSLAAYWQ